MENLTFEQASQQVNALGFIPSKEERYDDEVPVGQVIGYRDFNEGEKLTYGSRIILLVSLGPDPSASSSGN